MAMMKPLEVPPLGISERETEIRFEKLQATLTRGLSPPGSLRPKK